MRLLFLTQRVDADHDILGFVVGWLDALGAATDRLEVVAQWVGRHPWRPSDPGARTTTVQTLGKERGASKITQLVRLQRVLYDAIVRRRAVDLIFCHMCPEYVPLCYPLARLRRIPIVLWYTHATDSTRLRLAVALAQRTLTASIPGFPFRHPKVTPIGHGIDMRKFRASLLPRSDGPRVIVSIGRISPVKDHETVVRAVALVLARDRTRALRLRIVGEAPVPAQRQSERRLQRLIVSEGLERVTDLVGAVPYREIERELAASHVFVSASRTGSLDKAVLEAMACGLPVLTCNPAFRSELGGVADRLMFRPGDAADLANRIEHLLGQPPAELESLGRELARRIAGRHDLDGFVERVLATCRLLCRSGSADVIRLQ